VRYPGTYPDRDTLFLQLSCEDTKFNITSFGSRYDRLWDTAQPYDDDNLATALRHVQKMTANYGGTEILNPIRGKQLFHHFA